MCFVSNCKLVCKVELNCVSANCSGDFTCSLHRLRRVLNLGMRKYEFIYVYLSL